MRMENSILIESKKKSNKKAVIIGWLLTFAVILACVIYVAVAWTKYSKQQKNVIEYFNSTELNFDDLFVNSSVKNGTYDEQREFYLKALAIDFDIDTLYDIFSERFSRDSDLGSPEKNAVYETLADALAQGRAKQVVADQKEYKKTAWAYITNNLGVPENISFFEILFYDTFKDWFLSNEKITGLLIPVIALVLIMLVFQVLTLLEKKKKIIIEKRGLICTGSLGKEIVFPIKRSLTVKKGLFNGIRVKSPEHRYYISSVSNGKEIVDVVNNVKSEMQKAISDLKTKTSKTEELLKLKELLDAGVITQDEFDAKKKAYLNL